MVERSLALYSDSIENLTSSVDYIRKKLSCGNCKIITAKLLKARSNEDAEGSIQEKIERFFAIWTDNLLSC